MGQLFGSNKHATLFPCATQARRTTPRCSRRRSSLLLVLAASVAGFAGPVAAEESLWQKGSELLGAFSRNSASSTAASSVGAEDVGSAFKEALQFGTDSVVAQLGQNGGFSNDPAIHIPLPGELDKVKKVLATVGMSGQMDELEAKLNEAAEAATPKARALFTQAIQAMTFADVMAIYNGPPDAATRYFQDQMTPQLMEEMRPIVESTLADVGAVQTLDSAMGQYRALPFVPDVKADLTRHVLDSGLAGIFHYLAQEEAAIRTNPAKQTTDLLRRVFGAQ